ncbi:MAG: hypothetical protein Q8S94_09880 [Pseudohongiella sp.]|nr:hypothetical protein [Pseudohongiella sp.]
MGSLRRKCLLLLMLLSGMISEASEAQHADELGRLFSTPRERMELDEIRRIWLQEVKPGEELELPAEDELSIVLEAPNDLFLQLGGTVRRADGTYSLWINNEQVDQHQLPSNIKLARLGDLIVVWINYRDKLYVVRPGQVLHFATETVYEPYLLPAELEDLIFPPPAPEITTTAGANAATSNDNTNTVAQSGDAPLNMLPGGDAIEGLLENISKISATLNMIQELTQ